MSKLIRDNIPKQAENSGIVFRQASEEEYHQLLKEKLIEEAQELINGSTAEDIIHEAADVLQVLYELIWAAGVRVQDVDEYRLCKGYVAGYFADRWVVDDEETLSNYWDYLRKEGNAE